MPQYEYKVVPTPRRPKRAKGVKGNSARFANVLTDAMNTEAAGGWEFVRTETLPMEAKPGMFSRRVESFQSVMVFRRGIYDPHEEARGANVAAVVAPAVAGAAAVGALSAPVEAAPAPEPAAAPLAAERGPEPLPAEPVEPGPVAMPEPVEEVAAFAGDAAEEVEETVTAALDEVAGADQDLEFDSKNVDPLKKVVEANRAGH